MWWSVARGVSDKIRDVGHCVQTYSSPFITVVHWPPMRTR